MLTMEEACERVNARIQPVCDGYRDASDATLLCAGTDVPGPALVQQIKMDMAQFALAEGDEVALVAAMFGLLVRTFWLGYVFGEEAE